ncbi:hypothetical protein HG535_0H01240 [Zygotorulaspora mrakii]|uniref:K Homology domain-containing protein n=1 Tax=Zygotorulaspora mrakii TaxID=42260 RepID=A0A7H9B867_ZYGMR|nr:uncharacterized protein HG535_0H01240 [Zygotorulaspora mrakii]QLG74797.1 hypothetical protein HG535_0H01240 [Zygotorulaspora mrakii]
MSASVENEVDIETPPTSVDSSQVKTEDSLDSEAVLVEEPKPLPSLKDLPSLCSNTSLGSAKVAWGPHVRPPAPSTVSSSPSPSPSSNKSNSRPMRSKTIQEAFTLDLQSQLSINKPEFSRIVQSVKQTHSVSVESTLSKNSRTFLISGYPENVREGRRELIKKLTKPIVDVFQVPSGCKAAIIGSGGKHIREIQDSLGVRINLAKENNPDSFDEDLNDFTSDISIEGDIESVKLAKQRIAKTVKEETKNASIKISLENESFVPFVDFSSFSSDDDVKVQFFEKSGDILISGLLEDAKATKIKIQDYLKQLETEITEERIVIPRKFQFLIDVEEIREKFNVVVKLPTKSVEDQKVSFLGTYSTVKEAIDFARTSSKAYAVDTLDISKSHSKNLSHAKNLALYFSKYDALKNIQDAHPDTKILLPSPEELALAESVDILISGKNDQTDEIKNVRKELISLVNDITPQDTLIIDDLDFELFGKEIKKILLGQENEASLVQFVQFGDYYPDNDSILLVATPSNEDFKPSVEEIKQRLDQVSSSLESLRSKQNNLETKTIHLSSNDQNSLFLDSKVTLGLISEEANQEEGHLQIKLHTPSDDEITLRGNGKALKVAAKAFECTAKAPSKKAKTTVEIPANAVARLIGSKGSNSQQIREKFDVQIDIPSETENGKSVEVTLTGLQYNMDIAKSYIAAEAKKWADIVSKELIAPQKYHRNLIGPQGIYCQRLQDKYNVRVMFPKTGDSITIRGPSRGVAKAYEELKALLDFEMENGHKSVIKIKTECVSRIIGKNGDVINDIRADYGVRADFLQSSSDAKAQELEEVDLEITGSRQAIKDAVQKINSIIAEVQDFVKKTIDVDPKYHGIILGSGGRNLRELMSKAGGDECKSRFVDIPKANSESRVITVEGPKKFVDSFAKEIKKIIEDGENSITKELDIPSERQGALVGPGGVVRRQLESEFHVILKIPNKNEEGRVTITGLPENVAKAEKKISSDIVKENFDHELQVPAKYHEFVSERGALIRDLRSSESINVRHGNGTKKANQIIRRSIIVPAERVRGSGDEKIKFISEEIDSSEESALEGTIPWRLSYEPVNLDDLFEDDDAKKTKTESDPSNDSNKKQSAIEKAVKIIEGRIALAPSANTVGYIWTANPKNFNKIVGPAGSNIKKLREATGTVINVPKKSDKINDTIVIKGTKEGVEKAADMITKQL